MKNQQTTIQKNIWVAIDEVCVTIVVTAKRVVIYNERYLSATGKRFVMQQAKNCKPSAIVLSKQQRHVKRTPKNQTKATLLSVKQAINGHIKTTTKNTNLNDRVKTHLLKMHNKMKSDFTY